MLWGNKAFERTLWGWLILLWFYLGITQAVVERSEEYACAQKWQRKLERGLRLYNSTTCRHLKLEEAFRYFQITLKLVTIMLGVKIWCKSLGFNKIIIRCLNNKTLNCNFCGNPRKRYPRSLGKHLMDWLWNEVQFSRSLKALKKLVQNWHHIFKVPKIMEIDLSRPRHLFAKF